MKTETYWTRALEQSERALKSGALVPLSTSLKRISSSPENNFELDSAVDSAYFIDSLPSKGILLSNMGSGKLRMVTHMDYTDQMHEKLLETLIGI